MEISQEGTASGTGGVTTDRPGDSGLVASIEDFSRRLVETVDVLELAGLYADDALQISEYAPGLHHGREQITRHLEKTLGSMASRELVDVDVNVVSNGNLAVAHGQHLLTETSADGTTENVSNRFHHVLRKHGDSWRVLVQHTSFIADFKAQTVWSGGFLKRGVLHWDQEPFPTPAVSVEEAGKELNLWQIDDVRAQVAEQAMHFYGPGDYATVYDTRYPEGRMVGMWDTFQGWLGQMQHQHIEETLEEFRIWTDGQFAANFTKGYVVASNRNGTDFRIEFRQTDVLHKVAGQWYSYSEHVSFPFEPGSKRLILDLKTERMALAE